MAGATKRIRVRTILTNLALVTTSVLFVLGGAELILRLFPDLMTEAALLRVHWFRSGDPRDVAISDPYIGFLYPPRDEAAQGRGESLFRYTLDEHGFRNPSPWPDSTDIVVLGDSWTFGYGVSDDEGWVTLLSDELAGRRVINLGLIGSAPEQYARIFEKFGTALRPKLVIFGLFPGNDVHDTRTFNRWLNRGGPGNYVEWRRYGNGRSSWHDGLRRRSYLFVLIGELVKNRDVIFAGRTIDLESEGRLRLTPSLAARNAALVTPDNRHFRRAVTAILRTRELARAQGADFVVLLYPTKEEVYLPVLDEPTPDAIGPFVTALEENGVQYVDLRPIMQEHARAGERLYFEIDGHANRKGYRVIADTVATWIAGRPEVDKPHVAGAANIADVEPPIE